MVHILSPNNLKVHILSPNNLNEVIFWKCRFWIIDVSKESEWSCKQNKNLKEDSVWVLN